MSFCKKSNAGVTIIEAVVGVAVFIIIAVGVYEAYRSVYALIGMTRQKITALALANEQLEIIRNLPYADVGIVNGVPAGKNMRTQTLTRSGATYNITASIRNIDDHFDGTVGGTPHDLSPADYKLVQLDVTCALCKQFEPFAVSTYVSPRALELSSNNGAILVKVFDANGLPVADATVHVVNSHAAPPIDITETTNNAGQLDLIDVPPGVEAYTITVTKEGYSTETTYPTLAPNLQPDKANPTVEAQKATSVSFAIDKLSTLTIAAVDDSCVGLSGVNFQLTGAKPIGKDPLIPKYSEHIATGADGTVALPEMEWDNYSLAPSGVTGSVRYFADLPIKLLPDTEQKEVVVVTPGGAAQTYSILVNVKDAVTGLAIPDATVTLTKDAIAVPANADCAPTDHTLFLGLEPAIYHIVVAADGYQPFEGGVEVSGSWQNVDIVLNK